MKFRWHRRLLTDPCILQSSSLWQITFTVPDFQASGKYKFISTKAGTHRPPTPYFAISPSLFFFFFGLFRAAPVAYESSHATGQIGDVAASLHHSHSNAGSKMRLQPIPQLMAMMDP